MNDDLARLVHQAVQQYLDLPNNRLDVGNPQDFTNMVAYVRGEVPGLDGVADDEVCRVVAMCWLGPVRAGIPPRELRTTLAERMGNVVPDPARRIERAMEFTVALGCGLWRAVNPDGLPWERAWQGAIRALARGLWPAVRRANDWLSGLHMVGFPAPRCNQEINQDAGRLALLLAIPESPLPCCDLRITCTPDGARIEAGEEPPVEVPPGAHFVCRLTLAGAPTTVRVLARDTDAWVEVAGQPRATLCLWQSMALQPIEDLVVWECSCGSTHCTHRHRAESWDPANPQVNLWSFVASAANGPNAHLQHGSFLQGMYFGLLAREGF